MTVSHEKFNNRCLVFRKTKDLYLIITQKLIILKSVKSGGFHHEICEIWWILGEIHPKPYKIKCFNKNSSVWGGCMEGGYDPRFHEIQGHSPSPAFIKLNSFCWIWFYKVLGGFHLKSRRILCEIERPLTRNCNPMFTSLVFFSIWDEGSDWDLGKSPPSVFNNTIDTINWAFSVSFISILQCYWIEKVEKQLGNASK